MKPKKPTLAEARSLVSQWLLVTRTPKGDLSTGMYQDRASAEWDATCDQDIGRAAAVFRVEVSKP